MWWPRPRPPGERSEASRGQHCFCARGRLCTPAPGAEPPWLGGQGSLREEVSLLLHGTPVCVWVEKAMHRLEPEKEMGVRAAGRGRAGSRVPPPDSPTTHSPCGVLLQAEASGHAHHILWVLRAPVAQGDLGGEDHSPSGLNPAPMSSRVPCHPRSPAEASWPPGSPGPTHALRGGAGTAPEGAEGRGTASGRHRSGLGAPAKPAGRLSA